MPHDHASLLKVAIVHHNPSPMPSDWIDRFASIINAGLFKKHLEDNGFDLVIHGHQHQTNCTYEEFLTSGGVPPHSAGTVGLYILGAPSLGARDRAGEPGFLELRLDDVANAHASRVPASRVSVHLGERSAGGYRIRERWNYRFSIGKPLFAHMKFLHERFGRLPEEYDTPRTREAVDLVMPPMLSLQGQLDDWDNATWDRLFHENLSHYDAVYGVDRLGPTAWLNTRYLFYLCQQFQHRMSEAPSPESPQEVVDAVLRTEWTKESTRTNRSPGTSRLLTIARILLWNSEQCSGAFARGMLQTIDSLHRLFGVPIFVLDPAAAPGTGADIPEEFVLGLYPHAENRTPIGFVFDVVKRGSTQRIDPNRSPEYLRRFHTLLAHPELKTIRQVLDGR